MTKLKDVVIDQQALAEIILEELVKMQKARSYVILTARPMGKNRQWTDTLSKALASQPQRFIKLIRPKG